MTTWSPPRLVTDRDLEVLRFAAQQYGLPLGLLAEMVPGDRVARRVAGRLEEAGLARRQRVVGETWLVPTQRGIDLSGLDYRLWRPAGWKLTHHAAVARLRLYLAEEYPEAGWVPERELRRLAQGSRGRRADGALLWPDRTLTGVELERTVKARRKPGMVSGVDRYTDIVRQSDPRFGEVWWFCPAGHVRRLTERLAAAGGGDRHQVYPLPFEVPA